MLDCTHETGDLMDSRVPNNESNDALPCPNGKVQDLTPLHPLEVGEGLEVGGVEAPWDAEGAVGSPGEEEVGQRACGLELDGDEGLGWDGRGRAARWRRQRQRAG